MSSPNPEQPVNQPARKPWFDMVSCCFGALIMAGIIMISAVGLLSLYSRADESFHGTSTALQFPENIQAMEKASDQLARDGAALAGIEPAAGKNP